MTSDQPTPEERPLVDPSHPEHLQSLYEDRFAGKHEFRDRVWRILTKEWFSRWIPATSTVLDLGCGYGEFINNVVAGRRLAMDLNPDAANLVGPGVELVLHDCSTPWPIERESVDVVFTSNFLEHLLDKPQVMATLRNAHAALKPGGRIVALGPNLRCLPGLYWDFFDHLVPLTERSLGEALQAAGFVVEESIPRFLPYTMSGARTYPPFFLSAYLRMRPAWRILGKQFLVVARRP
jgi:SAM-dependent methyltransferase